MSITDLAIVTLTNKTRPDWLELSVDSVRKQMPVGACHHVIYSDNMMDFARIRLESLRLAKYIVFVDDDDLIINDSLRRCMDAIDSHKTSVAFTDEMLIDTNGNCIEQFIPRNGLTYKDVTVNVRTIHHTTVFEANSVSRHVEQLVRKTGCYSSVDWLIKASAALHGGAVHLPMQGYGWRQHESNMHKAEKPLFNKNSYIFSAFFADHDRG